MAHRERPLSPHLQIYKFQYTMVLSIAHRITGIFLSLGSILFVTWLMALALGRDSYAAVSALLSGTFAKVVWAGLIVSFCYHLLNGIRHLAWDCGYGLEKGQARASGWMVVLATVLLSALVFFRVFDLGEGWP